MHFIEIFQDDKLISKQKLSNQLISLGRHRENDIVLNEATISRFQARIEQRGQEYILINLANQKSLKINGECIEGEHVLCNKDVITVACFKLRYKVEPSPLDIQVVKPSTQIVNPNQTSQQLSSIFGASDDFEQASTTLIAKSEPILILLLNEEEISKHTVKDEVIIGRSKKCDICISLDGLSRQHARVFRNGEQVFIEDLGSQNGTWINRIQVHGKQELQQGDLLNFYEYNLLFLTSNFAAQVNPEASMISELDDVPLSSNIFNEADDAHVEEQPLVNNQEIYQNRIELGEAFKEVKNSSEQINNQDVVEFLSEKEALFSLLRQQLEPCSAVLEIGLNGIPYTQVTLSSQVTRIGSDAGCEIALPKESGILDWHVTLIKWSTGLLITRALPEAELFIDETMIESKVLYDGDILNIGSVEILVKITES